MDFRYKSELNEFFIRRENLEEISRIKVNQEDDEKNPILTPILMKYGKIFYLVFQIQNKGIYGIEVNMLADRTLRCTVIDCNRDAVAQGPCDSYIQYIIYYLFRFFLITNMVLHL